MGLKGNSWDNPCYNDGHDCPDRTLGCHSTCQKHLEWKNAHEKLANKKRREISKRGDAIAYTSDVHRKLTKIVNRAKNKRGWVK